MTSRKFPGQDESEATAAAPASEAEIRDFLEREAPRYQKIQLGEGLATIGADRSYLHDIVFADDISNQSLLDIGSSMGHFCFEALRRGATAATGLETGPDSVRQARQLNELLGSSAEFIEADFDVWEPAASYDVVLCLNVMHHLFDPIGSLRKLLRITRRRAVLEVAGLEWAHLRWPRNWPLMLGATAAPIILLDDAKRNYDTAQRTFAFTKKSLSIICNQHTLAFEPLRFHRSRFRNRMIFEARRREIDHLVVVAGPSASGKSTLLDKLGASAALRSRFGIDSENPVVATARHADELPTGPIDTLLYHYDILRPFKRSIQSHRRDPALSLLDCARKVTIIDLLCEPGELRKRLEASKLGRFLVKKRNRALYDRYQQPEFLKSWYRSWIDATSAQHRTPPGRFIVRTDRDYSELPDTNAALELLTHD